MQLSFSLLHQYPPILQNFLDYLELQQYLPSVNILAGNLFVKGRIHVLMVKRGAYSRGGRFHIITALSFLLTFYIIVAASGIDAVCGNGAVPGNDNS